MVEKLNCKLTHIEMNATIKKRCIGRPWWKDFFINFEMKDVSRTELEIGQWYFRYFLHKRKVFDRAVHE